MTDTDEPHSKRSTERSDGALRVVKHGEASERSEEMALANRQSDRRERGPERTGAAL